MMNTNPKTIDFGTSNAGTEWMVINDNVMGGRTQATKTITDSSLLLNGILSLENNGGFSSIRATNSADLSDYKTVTIQYKSDYDFAFRLELYREFWLPNYKVFLSNSKNKWITKSFKLADFKQSIMGKDVNEKITEEQLASVIRMGFITAEKSETAFVLEIDSIVFE